MPAIRPAGPAPSLVAMDLFARIDGKTVLDTEREHVQSRVVKEQVGGEGVWRPEEERVFTAKQR